MTPRRATAPYDWQALVRLIQTNFAYMEGRIDPPSSMHDLDAAAIEAQAETGEVWVLEEDNHPVACVFLTPREGALYIGKLTVATSHRGRGLARRLVEAAQGRAQALGLPLLELQSRIELVENHAAFASMGFELAGETAHPGFDRPTSLTFRKQLA
ncbi:GNAT family N-acetyltransferase [Acidimangrovimonas sediminis]|uniref:GNAT family N-acetyltransferase n=1 Tax=Acidimangrovimonas sediminis TaxID=2056283 RepID=UPI000C803A33|nr:GNAT family N-acetyltransferase [Acidimangrovimonas sediminis]